MLFCVFTLKIFAEKIILPLSICCIVFHNIVFSSIHNMHYNILFNQSSLNKHIDYYFCPY